MNDRKLPTREDIERMDIAALEAVASGRYPISVDKSEVARCALRVIKRMRAEIERLRNEGGSEVREQLPGFRITGGKGFHVTFQNGYTVSVQFGGGNYCDNYDDRIGGQAFIESGEKGSSNAECAVWGPNGNMIDKWEDTVSNRSSPADVLELLNWAASQPSSAKVHPRTTCRCWQEDGSLSESCREYADCYASTAAEKRP